VVGCFCDLNGTAVLEHLSFLMDPHSLEVNTFHRHMVFSKCTPSNEDVYPNNLASGTYHGSKINFGHLCQIKKRETIHSLVKSFFEKLEGQLKLM